MSVSPDHAMCPPDETLAAYIDGRLDEAGRKRVEQHMTTCDACYAVFLMSVDAKTAVAPRNVVRFPFRGRTAAVASVAAAAVIVLALYGARDWYVSRTAGIPALVKAAGALPERKVQARLSGGFAHRDLHAPRGGDDPKEVAELQLAATAAAAAEAAERRPSPKRQHALGVALLLSGSPAEAIAALEKADLDDPRVLNDLAAAYHERGRFAADEQAQRDFAKAVELAENAWSKWRAPETAWNRALALQQLETRRDDAIAAWNDYLALDGTSPWAEEARGNIELLRATR